MMDYGAFALLVSAASLLATWLFRTPKETANELQQRVAALEGALNALGREYAGIHGRHDEALRSLTTAVTRLTDRFETYMGTTNGRRP